ncbi:glycerol-1-phosphate dehydrogenase [NAD(P)+] [Neobacillus niacini]|uniref:sn-glycerol-1-phosphate dehydrogenase n=1 Tax=Neobacillus niacini TaxID=86668 RepID=UPI0027888ECB|nr:sn-glycerol-1-phosphate dehydrogenase [Neobacillus niacini]MDQ1004571.1 glycerol-1-phosphate dehydrogenase [NAD(P)+] [Neobacillus niacini]
MENYIAELMTLAQSCDCGNHHHTIPIERIKIGNSVYRELAAYAEYKGFKHVVIIADENTYQAAGKSLSEILKETGISISLSVIKPDENNDVVADEQSLVQALLEIPVETDVIIAVGAGTLHDIARFCSTKMKLPFISVPTAPSVDGFTSMGAPLIVRGVKTTFQMCAPIAVFADLSVLKASPRKMVAAGFGDMLAKYTSLADWKFGHLAKGEPYCPLVAAITLEALESCVEKVERIAAADEEGIQLLIEALIKSGLAMLIFGQSHPASGGEHHLSHYWEMDFLQRKRPAVLHGAKVGVSTVLLAEVYKGKFLPLLSESMQNSLNNESLKEIMKIYEEIPTPGHLKNLLTQTGGEIMPEQLGIDEQLVAASLSSAHTLRNRYTALKFMNVAAESSPLIRR